ncbi:MAG: hypothetical protein ACYT04_56365 [Nostoc sp.]
MTNRTISALGKRRKNMRSLVPSGVERWIIYLSVIEVMGNQSNYQAIL